MNDIVIINKPRVNTGSLVTIENKNLSVFDTIKNKPLSQDNLSLSSIRDNNSSAFERPVRKISEDTSLNILNSLQIKNITSDKDELESLRKVLTASHNKPSELRAFCNSFNSLSGTEQKAVLKINHILSSSSLKEGYKQEIKSITDSLTDKGSAVGKTLDEIGVYIPSVTANAPGSEDTTPRIQRMFMGDYELNDPQADYVRDMLKIGKTEGFRITLQVPADTVPEELKQRLLNDIPEFKDMSELEQVVEVLPASMRGYVWGEDNKWVTSDGNKIKTLPPINQDIIKTVKTFTTADLQLKKVDSGFETEGHHAVGLPSSDPQSLVDELSTQGNVNRRNERLSAAALAKATGKELVVTRTYNEGGNIINGTLPNGESYAVVGRDGLLVSVFHLDEEFKKDPSKVPEFEKLDEKVKEMEANGQLDDKSLLEQTQKRLEAISYFTDGSDKVSETKKFLAKMEFTKQVFADDAAVPLKNMIFVPQPEFHLDMHMRPFKPGTMLFNDYSENIKLIEKALKEPDIKDWEKKELESMFTYCKNMKEVMDPVMNKIAETLEKSGIKAINSPGVIEGQMGQFKMEGAILDTLKDANPSFAELTNKLMTKSELEKEITARGYNLESNIYPDYDYTFRNLLNEAFTRNVNFMNAVPGTSIGKNSQFYITNFTSIAPLRKAFEEQMAEQGIEKVYWVADDNGGQFTKSLSEQSLDWRGGLDCRENH